MPPRVLASVPKPCGGPVRGQISGHHIDGAHALASSLSRESLNDFVEITAGVLEHCTKFNRNGTLNS